MEDEVPAAAHGFGAIECKVGVTEKEAKGPTHRSKVARRAPAHRRVWIQRQLAARCFGLTYRDHLRMVSLTADYRLQDSIGGWNYLSVTGRQGLNIFGASSKQDLDISRPGASPNFSLLSFSFWRLQQLSGPWSVKIFANGQWAGGPLLISQQFYLGDAAYGPGFYSGDSGILGYGELRFDQTVSNAFLRPTRSMDSSIKAQSGASTIAVKSCPSPRRAWGYASFSRMTGRLVWVLPCRFVRELPRTT